jgi:anti-sigma28 factor (negative regulator of flagellin synthesis)
MYQEAMSRSSSTILSLKINPTNSQSIAGLGRSSAAAPAGPAKGTGSLAPTEPTDQTVISNLSKYLAAAMTGSPAHVEKLNALGAAVSAGNYHVDSDAVSEGIIQHSLLFSGAW